MFDTPLFEGKSTFNTGLFIGGEWVDPVEPATIRFYQTLITPFALERSVSNPAAGEGVTDVAAGSSKDVDLAVDAAKKAYKSSWGLKVPGTTRGRLLSKLADLVEKNKDELAALEALNVGKPFAFARQYDISGVVDCLRYVAGWCDKHHGKTIETNEGKLAYTRNEPFGVVGLIVPWNFPLAMLCNKFAPALATGNTVVIKPSEITPLTNLRLVDLINAAGFPPGVVNIVNGYGHTVGQAMSEHPLIDKISFTGSTLTGRKILKASAESNLKKVSLELGGKSPTIIFDDADLDQAVKWAAQAVFFNSGQACLAGSRIFVQEGIYDQFLEKITAIAQQLTQAMGDPFESTTHQGPLVSKAHFDRVMGYINSGKEDGATVHVGGQRQGNHGYFVQPTLFTNVHKDMKIVREEIFGPVGVVIKFKTEEEVIEQANDTVYGLVCNVFSENSSRAIRVAHSIEAGTVWVNFALASDWNVPFGGYKQSGIGRELGEAGIHEYTQVKSVFVNLGIRL
ncbi:hypothetical protein AX16_009782 [Volvariella volvacea WC 439]|nr:hypothetical protein AX16_009782 [Volvariella volvacea WC 439]